MNLLLGPNRSTWSRTFFWTLFFGGWGGGLSRYRATVMFTADMNHEDMIQPIDESWVTAAHELFLSRALDGISAWSLALLEAAGETRVRLRALRGALFVFYRSLRATSGDDERIREVPEKKITNDELTSSRIPSDAFTHARHLPQFPRDHHELKEVCVSVKNHK